MSKKTRVVRIVRAVKDTVALVDSSVTSFTVLPVVRFYTPQIADLRELRSDTDAVAKDLWGVLKQYDERKAARR